MNYLFTVHSNVEKHVLTIYSLFYKMQRLDVVRGVQERSGALPAGALHGPQLHRHDQGRHPPQA